MEVKDHLSGTAGEKGHFKDKCPKPPKDSARSNSKGKLKSEGSREKSGGAANAVDSDSDGVFAVSCETEDEDESDDFYVLTAPTSAHVPSDADSMPDLQSVSATDPELDPESLPDLERVEIRMTKMRRARTALIGFSEVASDAGDYADESWDDADGGGERDFRGAGSCCGRCLVPLRGSRKLMTYLVWRFLTPEQPAIFPLTTMTSKPYPKFPRRCYVLQTKAISVRVGEGELVINLPNGVDVSQLRLTEVLYAPEVGVHPCIDWGVSTRWLLLPHFTYCCPF